ncbi:conserved hypothetical protein [Thioalkalivibrio sulfidiphilus HL-EbGr7]|uniref:Type IV pilus assembly protein PilW n=1 Tax=Thioalkalivibrio sulfidiphilus (strain HL-EbGR7) TaxID=396588 RepID=B8GQS1_THISH|nr:PilW family protein [Thioalkalivibrio sulfidiphilus]ACL74295.1 conserved hypothetical protein [Thioalkalivibrio sulfidiphilus HL-EbGr7]
MGKFLRIETRKISMRRQKGLSLVELMVAMVIALILTAGVISIFVGSQTAYRFNDAMSRVQENGRYAINVLSHDVRMAGYAGCARPGAVPISNIANPPTLGDFDPALLVEGMDDVSAGTTIGTRQVVAGTDVLILRGGSDAVGQLNAQKVENANAQLVANAGGWVAGDVLMVTDCTAVDIFRATNVSSGASGTTIAHASSMNTQNFLSKVYFQGAEVMAYRERSYFVAFRDANAPVPSLYRRVGQANSEELVEGVEDLQILYGVDTSGDQQVDTYMNAGQVAAANRWPDVLSVRLSMLLVSPENNVIDAPQQITFNGVTFTPADRRLRQIATTTIGLRNRLP